MTALKKTFLTFFILNGPFLTAGSFPPFQSNPAYSHSADVAFQKLEELLKFDKSKIGFTYLSKKDSMIFRIVEGENRYSNYRKEGLKFWKEFPNDIRKYRWFRNTWRFSIWYNRYWNNVEAGARKFQERSTRSSKYSMELNWEDLREWEDAYPKMLKEYELYCSRMNLEREYEETLTFILNSFLKLSLNEEYRNEKKLDLAKLKKFFLPAAERIFSYNMNERHDNILTYKRLNGTMNRDFISVYREYGLDKQDMMLFFSSLAQHSLFGIQEWAWKGTSLFLLMEDSGNFQFKHKSITGDVIDFQKMRGKVVLVDFWATWCSSCIDRMPAIKRVYDKYKSNNFIVISACLNDDSALSEVKNIIVKVGANWPTLLIGSVANINSLGYKIWKKYNFWGVPQLLLFNKEGRLVLINDVLKTGDFEPLIEDLLVNDQ